jgi:hypothetical protein
VKGLRFKPIARSLGDPRVRTVLALSLIGLQMLNMDILNATDSAQVPLGHGTLADASMTVRLFGERDFTRRIT